jgi:hypothetical protein
MGEKRGESAFSEFRIQHVKMLENSLASTCGFLSADKWNGFHIFIGV